MRCKKERRKRGERVKERSKERWCKDVLAMLIRGQCYETFYGSNLRIFVIS